MPHSIRDLCHDDGTLNSSHSAIEINNVSDNSSNSGTNCSSGTSPNRSSSMSTLKMTPNRSSSMSTLNSPSTTNQTNNTNLSSLESLTMAASVISEGLNRGNSSKRQKI